jgi:hypothetical protein
VNRATNNAGLARDGMKPARLDVHPPQGASAQDAAVATASPVSRFAEGPLNPANTLRAEMLLYLANDPSASAQELRAGLRQAVPYILDSGEWNVAMQMHMRSLTWHIRLLMVLCSALLGWTVCATWPQ